MTKIFAWTLLPLVLIFLLWQASQFPWQYHLRVDVDGQYLNHARAFWRDGNLANIGYNEYLPGAVLFFIALSPVLSWLNTNNTYLYSLFATNAFLIVVLSFFYVRFGSVKNTVAFWAILAVSGPILLFRFDLFVAALVVAALLAEKKQRSHLAAFFLGLATATKIYPILVLPLILLAIPTWRRQLAAIGLFLLGLAIPIGIYTLGLSGSLLGITEALRIHQVKPVAIESLWGTVLTLIPKITSGQYALGQGSMGIFGISPEFTIGPPSFYNYFWLVILGSWYFLLWATKNARQFRVENYLVTILLFLLFSKIVVPQYLFWFVFLFPLLPVTTTKAWLTDFLLILAIMFLTQIIYPLRYNELLGCFYSGGGCAVYFWITTLRNLLLVVLAIKFLRQILWLKR